VEAVLWGLLAELDLTMALSGHTALEQLDRTALTLRRELA
jgi:isopentenyl diphosphate isomerase/L-lactate dehydrogenase-like FMN-dependent dehydrogenase